jgi:subtilisin family serine protease
MDQGIQVLRGMRNRLSSLIAGAIALGMCASAPAATQTQISLGGDRLDLSSVFTPTQFAADGSVYGVHARGNVSLPTIQILPQKHFDSSSLTPDPCDTAGFPGGWCMTPHSIAASAFGWDFSSNGKGVIIGIVDTGIDLNNPEFTGRVLKGGCIVSAVNPCTSNDNKRGGDLDIFPGADSTHGTHVTGIAAGTNTGLAYQASILPVKVCSSDQDACDGVSEGVLWAAQHKASVINVSIGGPTIAPADISEMAQAVSDGALLVVAAGNSGTRDPTGGFLSEAALQDGVRGSMIVVGATECNPNSQGTCANGGFGSITSFSQVPSTRCEVHDGSAYCMKDYFVVAPGVDIWSSVGNGGKKAADYGYLSGTSMATPYVTGVAALIKGDWPYLRSDQIASVIFQTADDLGALGVDPVYGHGEVDVTKAMNPVDVPPPPPPPGTVVLANSYQTAGGLVPTSAGTLGANLQSKGATNALASMVTGPLAAAISKSSILKHAVVIDSFGRDFNADLTAAANVKSYYGDLLMSDDFTSVSPFAMGMEGPFGPTFASGYSIDTTTPRLISGELRDSDYTTHSVQDLNVTTQIFQGMTADFGYRLDMAGRFNEYDASASPAYDGLFMSASAVNSPYASLANGGSFIGTTIALASDLRFRFGEASLGAYRDPFAVDTYSMVDQIEGQPTSYDLRTVNASVVGVSWDFANWGGLGLTATQTSEENGLLGGFASGALSTSDAANTTALGVSARVGFGDGWVTTASYSEGITQLDLKPNGLITSADALHSRAYGIAVAKHGLFGDDSLGFAVTRPIQIYSGGANITAADGVDDNGNLIIGHEHLSLATSTPETDIELGYVTTFLDGALALQANAAYQVNLAGQDRTNALALVSRAKIKF